VVYLVSLQLAVAAEKVPEDSFERDHANVEEIGLTPPEQR
jgi:hypothetical protein